LIKPSITSILIPLSNILNIQGIRILTGVILGPGPVVILTSIRTFCRIIIQPSTILSRIIEPEVTIAYGSNKLETMSKIFTNSTRIIFWIGMLSLLFLIIFGDYIFNMWSHNKIILEQPLFLILLIAAFFNILTANMLTLPSSINKHKLIAFQYLTLSGIAPLIVSILVIKFFGINGVAFSLLFFEFITLIILLKVILKVIDQKLSYWLPRAITPPFFIAQYLIQGFKK
jgi:O-antigen/teichoic acid export membrane protein